jgi:hypothetical protein
MQQMDKALSDVEQGFTAVAIPGNAELQGEVDAARQQEQLHLAQQDIALDKIHAAASRVADLGLGMMHELRVRPARLFWLSIQMQSGNELKRGQISCRTDMHTYGQPLISPNGKPQRHRILHHTPSGLARLPHLK